MHCIYETKRTLHTSPIIITYDSDLIVAQYIQIYPVKIAAIVEVNIPN